jgi:hypothetical protein
MTINNRCLVASASVGELLSVVEATRSSIARYFNDVGYLGMDEVYDDIANHTIQLLEQSLADVQRLTQETKLRLSAPHMEGTDSCHAQ